MSMQGYLKKRNERGVWQQRWFVLQGLELKYYNSQKDATGGKDPKGVIPVSAPHRPGAASAPSSDSEKVPKLVQHTTQPKPPMG